MMSSNNRFTKRIFGFFAHIFRGGLRGWTGWALDALHIPRQERDGRRIISAATLQRWLRNSPIKPLGDIISPGNILVFAPHPDDDVIGCGGLIIQAQTVGRTVHIVFLTDGSAAIRRPGDKLSSDALVALREQEARRAARLLCVPQDRLHFFRVPDRTVPSSGVEFDKLVARLAMMLRHQRIGTIITTSDLDPHPDHQGACAIARQVSTNAGVRLLCCPVTLWGMSRRRVVSYRTIHASRLDVRQQLATKRAALEMHASQVSVYEFLLDWACAPFEVYLSESV